MNHRADATLLHVDTISTPSIVSGPNARTLRWWAHLVGAQAQQKRRRQTTGSMANGTETLDNGSDMTDDDAVPDDKCKVESNVTGT